MTFINNCDAASGPGAWLNAHPLLQGLPPSVLQKLVEQAELRPQIQIRGVEQQSYRNLTQFFTA